MMKSRLQSATIRPADRPMDADLCMPGDKSISQRLALLLPLAAGRSTVRGFLRGEDALHTLKAMGALGARIHVHDSPDGEAHIDGCAGRLMQPVHPLYLGNSGTGLRLLTGLLAGTRIEVELTGDASLCSRPMGRIRDPLVRMGAEIELRGAKEGCAPIFVRGRPLKGICYELPVASAQVKSAVLLAALFADGITEVVEPALTRDHTERVLLSLGLEVERDECRLRVQGAGPEGPALKGGDWTVPGDLSSAAFWLAAAAAQPGSRVALAGVGLNPRRTAVLDVLRRMGADLTTRPAQAERSAWEPSGEITLRGGELHATEISGAEIPNLIDELPVLAVAAAFAQGVTTIRDAAELRVKESDRIRAICENLRQAGVEVEEFPDGFSVRGPVRFDGGASFSSRGDHRIAMSFAILSLFGSKASRIEDVACVATSYPGFWADLERVGGRVSLEV